MLPVRFNLVEECHAKRWLSFHNFDVHRCERMDTVTPMANGLVYLKGLKAALIAVNGQLNSEKRSLNFSMRPEQEEAVNKTARYFKNYKGENPDKIPHFLWNAKMRFGKTFTLISLQKKWAGQKSWCSPLSQQFRVPGKKTCSHM